MPMDATVINDAKRFIPIRPSNPPSNLDSLAGVSIGGLSKQGIRVAKTTTKSTKRWQLLAQQIVLRAR